MVKRKPFEKAILRSLTPETYLKKLENIIVDEGYRILRGLRVNFIVIHENNIAKFHEKHPEFIGVRWNQIGLHDLYHVYGRVSIREYKILITMKQVLNKNNAYILRPGEFDHRKYAMTCDRFKDGKVEICYQDDCPAALCCPKFYKIVEARK